jgi:hypothetical protein
MKMSDDEIKQVPFTGTLQEFKDAMFFFSEMYEGQEYIYGGAEYMYGEMILEHLIENCFDAPDSDNTAFKDSASDYLKKVLVFIPKEVPLPVLDAEWLAETLFDDYFNLDDEFKFSPEITAKIEELNKMIVKEVPPLFTPTPKVIDQRSIFRLLLADGRIRHIAAGGE